MIIVTGGAGFIGSALVGELLIKVINIIVVDSSEDFKNCSNLKPYKERLSVLFPLRTFSKEKSKIYLF